MTSLASDPEKVSPTAAFDKEEIASQRSERQPSLTFSEKSWKTILASCMPMAFICLLVWLDEAILATAIPRISDEFNSFDQIGWYGPSYLFGLCASQLPFGRAYKDFPSKITYLVSLGIFEIASIVQATAQSSPAFIVGRVLAGIGGSAVLTGSLTIFSEEVPKAKLPYIMGGFGWAHGVGGIAGPIIGGAITSSPLTWRWCFYLNPIASVVAMVPVLILWRGHFTLELKDRNASLAKVLARVDYLGILVFIAAVVMLLLGFQFGGSSYSWSDKRTVASLTVAGALALIFSAIQWWKGSNALVPKNILGMRVVLLSSLYSAALDGAYFILAYQIPLWFQTISGLSARDSGYRILPLLASCIVFTAVSAILTGRLQYYQPFMLLGAVLLTIGSSMLTTMKPGDSVGRWVGFQILAGAGTGLGTSLPLLAVQDVVEPSDIPIGYAVVLTAGYLASSIALATAQSVFATRLKSQFGRQLPEINTDTLINTSGATNIRILLPNDSYALGVQLYNAALTKSWYVAVVLGGVSVLLALGFKWKRMDVKDAK